MSEEQHYLPKKLANNGETVQLRSKETCYKTQADLLYFEYISVRMVGKCSEKLSFFWKYISEPTYTVAFKKPPNTVNMLPMGGD